MPPLTVSELRATAELEALAPAWEALWRRSPAATPFQSPAWLIPWWKHLGTGGDLLTLAVRADDGALAGLVPLYLLDEPPLRKLLPLGVSLSDHLGGVFNPVRAGEAAAAALDHLARAERSWDVCDLHQLAPGSPLLVAAAPAGLRDEIAPQEPCPVLALPAAPDGLDAALPRGAVQNLRFFRRRADRAGAVRYATAGGETLAPLLDAFLRLHGARWAERGEPGVLASDPVRRFHREAAVALLGLGVLRLHALLLDDCVIAAFYGFAAKGRAYAYLTGFDPSFARLAPGTLIVGRAIEEAVREGAAEFDFLRGREPHKYRWGAEDRPTYNRKLWREGAPRPGSLSGR